MLSWLCCDCVQVFREVVRRLGDVQDSDTGEWKSNMTLGSGNTSPFVSG